MFDWADRAHGGTDRTCRWLRSLRIGPDRLCRCCRSLLVARWLDPHLLGLLQFTFAVLVLLFAFGPRDLKDEVDDYADGARAPRSRRSSAPR